MHETICKGMAEVMRSAQASFAQCWECRTCRSAAGCALTLYPSMGCADPKPYHGVRRTRCGNRRPCCCGGTRRRWPSCARARLRRRAPLARALRRPRWPCTQTPSACSSHCAPQSSTIKSCLGFTWCFEAAIRNKWAQPESCGSYPLQPYTCVRERFVECFGLLPQGHSWSSKTAWRHQLGA